jgi:tetratricopeptide (TPR) repeat protein
LFLWICIWALSFELGAFRTLAADVARVTAVPARPQRLYAEAGARWRKETNSVEAAWRFGRAAFDLAELATNDTRRAALANEGIDACRRAIALDPKSAGAHYYLGLNYGQLAQTKLLGALKLVEQMEAAWKTTIALDPKFDYAGGHRTLGVLYRDAPGWPTSIGSRAKAREHFKKAMELSPDYPGNRLSLLEAYAKWGEKKSVQDQAGATEEFLKTARTRLTGEEWALDWQDWDKRWQTIKARCAVVAARSPREAR